MSTICIHGQENSMMCNRCFEADYSNILKDLDLNDSCNQISNSEQSIYESAVSQFVSQIYYTPNTSFIDSTIQKPQKKSTKCPHGARTPLVCTICSNPFEEIKQ